MTTPSSSLEQQLQEYRKKLSTYKSDGENSTTSSQQLGGGGSSLQPPQTPTNGKHVKDNDNNNNSSEGSQQQPNLFQDRQLRSLNQTPTRLKSSFQQQQQQQTTPTINRMSSSVSNFSGGVGQSQPANDFFSYSNGSPQIADDNNNSNGDGGATADVAPADVLFNYDDDFDRSEMSASDGEEEILTWRSDPAKSLSDWTLLVSNRETRETTPYHVHRNVLAVGPRKSEYFVRFFLSHDRLHKSTKSTELWFNTVAADAMPQLLDYMYSPDGKLDISTDCAVGLRHLAQFFGMRALHKKVMAYITLDLTMFNLKTYYQHTVEVDDTKVSELASTHCAQHVMEITEDDPLLSIIDPSFLRRILMADEIDSEEKQLHTSQLLAEYCRQHAKVIDDQDFIRLTDQRCLPRVHYSAALTLMEMESDLVLLDQQHEEDMVEEFTSLQNRCLADLTEHWEELSQMQPVELTRICRKLPSAVVTEIMVRSLGQAKKCLDRSGSGSSRPAMPQANGGKATSSSSSSSDSLISEYETQMANLKREHQEALDRIKSEFETNLVKMKEAVVEKDKFIAQYWSELRRFERVPNTPDGKMVQSTSSALKVLKMPSIGNQPSEGLILSKPKGEGGGGGGKFPIFIYNGKRQDDSLRRDSGHGDFSVKSNCSKETMQWK
ncbi:hypothetical protein ACA910_005565 [Epithemia clementina (nom. ined.)]